MRLDGFGLLVSDMGTMIRFYRDVLGFEIREAEDSSNVYLVKDGTLFLLYGRKDFEKMTGHRYEYVRGLNGHLKSPSMLTALKKWIPLSGRPWKTAPSRCWNPRQNPGGRGPATSPTRKAI